jgi:hypothetical protein
MASSRVRLATDAASVCSWIDQNSWVRTRLTEQIVGRAGLVHLAGPPPGGVTASPHERNFLSQRFSGNDFRALWWCLSLLWSNDGLQRLGLRCRVGGAASGGPGRSRLCRAAGPSAYADKRAPYRLANLNAQRRSAGSRTCCRTLHM